MLWRVSDEDFFIDLVCVCVFNNFIFEYFFVMRLESSASYFVL